MGYIETQAYAKAACKLAAGELVAFPTETVYGLGADACNPVALAQLFALKGRPLTHPVIVHIAKQADPSQWVDGALPAIAHRLIDAFWPGPLTLILKRAKAIPDIVSGGQDTIGLRCPAHPVAQALLHAFSDKMCEVGRLYSSKNSYPCGIAAPSANRFGRVSPTTAAHVRDEFGEAVLILEAGACEVGLESTILDISKDRPLLLRAGQLHAAQLAEVIGDWPLYKDDLTDQSMIPRASGTLKAHYAPNIPVYLCTATALSAALAQHDTQHPIAWVTYSPPHLDRAAKEHIEHAALDIRKIQMPDDPNAYARLLYKTLRDLEATDCQSIWVETPPSHDPAWAAIHDRLSRAAAAFDGSS